MSNEKPETTARQGQRPRESAIARNTKTARRKGIHLIFDSHHRKRLQSLTFD